MRERIQTETKLSRDSEHLATEGYVQSWDSSRPLAKKAYWSLRGVKKGLSGLEHPRESSELLGDGNVLREPVSHEGRILTVYFEEFILVTAYVPNTDRAGMKPLGGWAAVRDDAQREFREAEYNKYMELRAEWDNALLTHVKELTKISPNVILCGDMNAMRGPLDLYHGDMTTKKMAAAVSSGESKGRLNELNKRMSDYRLMDEHGGFAGFRLEERAEFEKFFQSGFEDAYRALYPTSYGFTLWNPKLPPYRKANNGLRLDYFIVTSSLVNKIRSIRVLKELGEVGGKGPSDHAPVVLQF